MDNNEYLDFDEAVNFLKTTPSTLYKWLQAGKIPGHKLGRQWRFLRGELEQHVSGKTPLLQLQKDASAFSELLYSRAKSKKGSDMDLSMEKMAERTIWDAHDHGAHMIHVLPHQGKYQIRYRTRGGLSHLIDIQEELFTKFDEAINQLSVSLNDPYARRLFLQRSEVESVQVRYQRVDTVSGPRLTLRLWRPASDILSLEKIGADASTKKRFRHWLGQSHGLIIISGSSASGKTTTLYAMLDELRKQGRVVFTIEDTAEMVLEGVDQVELKDRRPESFEQAYAQVVASDPDVLCFGLGSVIGLESSLYTAAYRAASTGHLVLIQMDAPSAEAALAEIAQHVPIEFEHLVVGISTQRLNRIDDRSVKAEYTLQDGSKPK